MKWTLSNTDITIMLFGKDLVKLIWLHNSTTNETRKILAFREATRTDPCSSRWTLAGSYYVSSPRRCSSVSRPPSSPSSIPETRATKPPWLVTDTFLLYLVLSINTRVHLYFRLRSDLRHLTSAASFTKSLSDSASTLS